MISKDKERSAGQQLKNLRDKAELCRYAHDRLHSRYATRQRWAVIFIAVVSFIMTFRVLGYLPSFLDWKEWMPIFGIVLSASILLVQTLSHTLGWKDKEIAHATSLSIWGQWIHNARFLQHNLSKYSDEKITIKLEEIFEEYERCMKQTEQIPSNKFLIYKAEFKQYRCTSEEIDKCSPEKLDEIKSKIKKNSFL